MANQADDATMTQRIVPNFFIIGAARSGTTMLAEMMRQHPDIFITQPKEPHYLALAGQDVRFTGPGDAQMINSVAVTGLEAYLALYGAASQKFARGDASVSTLYYPQRSIETLRREFPGARLIVVLRDPISRAFSAYSYLRVRGFEPCGNFVEAVQQENERVQQNWHHFWHYVGMGQYAAQLRPFVEERDPRQLKILFYENLIRDPAVAARNVFQYLDLDADFVVEAKQANASGTPRNRLMQKSMQLLTRQPQMRGLLKKALPFEIRERIRVSNLQPAEVSEEDRKTLASLFAPDIAKLNSLITNYYPELIDHAPSWLHSDLESNQATAV